MVRPALLAFAALLAAGAPRAGAAEPVAFACDAKGTAWRVTGSAATHMTCQFTCALNGPGEMVDHVSCTASLKPDLAGDVLCEGFMVGKRWSGAELVARQCAQQ